MVFTTQNRVPPAAPPTLREAMHRVAGLGGFLGRKGDRDPGTQTLWQVKLDIVHRRHDHNEPAQIVLRKAPVSSAAVCTRLAGVRWHSQHRPIDLIIGKEGDSRL